MATNNNNQMENRNRKSFIALLKENPNATFDIRKNDNGKPFFVLGDEVGYVSPNAMQLLEENAGKPLKDFASQLQYAESKKAGLPDYDDDGVSNWVPTLMVVGNRKPALFSFSAADLD